MLKYLMIFVVVIAAVVLGLYLWFGATKKKFAKAKEEDAKRRQERIDNLPSIPLSEREDDAIYQWSFHHGDRLVALARRYRFYRTWKDLPPEIRRFRAAAS